MASDYGDFCREQRADRQRRNLDRGGKNERELRGFSKQYPDVHMTRVGDHVRFAIGATAVDFWTSTGTAGVMGSRYYRRGMSIAGAVGWLRKLVAKMATDGSTTRDPRAIARNANATA